MTNGNMVTDQLGGTITSRIAGHLQRAIAQTRRELGPHQASVAQVILRDFTNHVSDEIRGVMGPLWNQIADSTETAPWLRNLARKLGTERGQAWTWIAGTSTSLAMGGGIGALLTNELQPIIGPAIRSNPHMPLSAADAAQAVSRGIQTEDFGYGDAGQWGLGRGRFRDLVKLNTNVLSLDMALDLLAKRWITPEQYQEYAGRAGWNLDHAEAVRGLGRVWPQPGVGGQMHQRGIVSMKELEEITTRSGHHVSDAKRYSELAGEPLPVGDLMSAQRRGVIDKDRAFRGWTQGPIRNEWFDVAQDLQYVPMSSVDAADAVNQNMLPLDEGRKIAMWNGLIGDHFETLIKTAGLPPGVELATEALNRGLLSLAEFRQAFLESRLKNKYVDLYTELRLRVIPQETVRRLFRLGVYTRDQAAERLTWAGFSEEDREALLLAEEGESSEATRELTKAEIVSLYTEGAIEPAQARSMLSDLGYPDGEVEWVVTLADMRRARTYVNAVVSRLRAGYVAGRLNETDVSATMDSLRIPPTQRDDLIDLWNLERQALTRGLTPAQVKAAKKKSLITEAEAMQRLMMDGYSEEDATIFLAL